MNHWLYLALLLLWVPVLGLQWLIGWKKLWPQRHTWPWIVLAASLYLSLADAVALSQQIWFFRPAFLIGWSVGNVPVEEMLFFVLMTAMVVQGFVIIAPSRIPAYDRQSVRKGQSTEQATPNERSRVDASESRE